MRHKALAIFEQLTRIINVKRRRNKELNYIDFLEAGDSSKTITVLPYFDSGEVNKVGYFTLIIHDNVSKKDIMKFTINGGGYMVLGDGFEIEGMRFPQEKFINCLIEKFYLDDNFQEAITVMEIDAIPPGSNPYRFDEWRQGCDISKHWQVMFSSRGEGEIDNVRLIHTKTGRRFDLDLYEAEKPK